MKEKYVGYVLNSIDYKDSDSLVSVLCEDGVVCLRARGVKKPTSKNASSVMNYAYSEFEVNKSLKNGFLTLSEGRLIKYPSFINNNLEYIGVINLVSEGLEIINDKGDSFKCFVDCLARMQEGYDSKYILIAFLNYFLRKQGCELNSDECVSCGGKERIVKFSFEDGGYLCRHCCSLGSDEVNYLHNMRVLSKVNCDNINKVNIDFNDTYLYIKGVFSIIESKIGVYFKSKNFLLRVIREEK